MAVHALHAVREMLVLEMNRLGEFLRVVMGNDVFLAVAQIAFAIMFEHRAENPAMTVIIGELRVRQLRIQLGNFFEKIGALEDYCVKRPVRPVQKTKQRR